MSSSSSSGRQSSSSSSGAMHQCRSDSPNLFAAATAAAVAATNNQQQPHHNHKLVSGFDPLSSSLDNMQEHNDILTCPGCYVTAAAAALAALNSSDHGQHNGANCNGNECASGQNCSSERDHEIDDWFHGIPFLCQFFEEYQSIHSQTTSSDITTPALATASSSSSGPVAISATKGVIASSDQLHQSFSDTSNQQQLIDNSASLRNPELINNDMSSGNNNNHQHQQASSVSMTPNSTPSSTTPTTSSSTASIISLGNNPLKNDHNHHHLQQQQLQQSLCASNLGARNNQGLQMTPVGMLQIEQTSVGSKQQMLASTSTTTTAPNPTLLPNEFSNNLDLSQAMRQQQQQQQQHQQSQQVNDNSQLDIFANDQNDATGRNQFDSLREAAYRVHQNQQQQHGVESYQLINSAGSSACLSRENSEEEIMEVSYNQELESNNNNNQHSSIDIEMPQHNQNDDINNNNNSNNKADSNCCVGNPNQGQLHQHHQHQQHQQQHQHQLTSSHSSGDLMVPPGAQNPAIVTSIALQIMNGSNSNDQYNSDGDQDSYCWAAGGRSETSCFISGHDHELGAHRQSQDDLLAYNDEVSDHQDCCSDHYEQAGVHLSDYQSEEFGTNSIMMRPSYMDEYEYANISTIRHYPMLPQQQQQPEGLSHNQQREQSQVGAVMTNDQRSESSVVEPMQQCQASNNNSQHGGFESTEHIQNNATQQLEKQQQRSQDQRVSMSQERQQNQQQQMQMQQHQLQQQQEHRMQQQQHHHQQHLEDGRFDDLASRGPSDGASGQQQRQDVNQVKIMQHSYSGLMQSSADDFHSALIGHLNQSEIVEHADHEEHNLLHNALMRSPEKLKLIDSIITLVHYASNYQQKMLGPLLEIKRCIERDLEVVLSDTSNNNNNSDNQQSASGHPIICENSNMNPNGSQKSTPAVANSCVHSNNNNNNGQINGNKATIILATLKSEDFKKDN